MPPEPDIQAVERIQAIHPAPIGQDKRLNDTSRKPDHSARNKQLRLPETMLASMAGKAPVSTGRKERSMIF